MSWSLSFATTLLCGAGPPSQTRRGAQGWQMPSGAAGLRIAAVCVTGHTPLPSVLRLRYADDMTRMLHEPAPGALRRRAVVDLGSNSVRLVVFQGESRNPMQIFNEKAVLRLARGLIHTNRLEPSAMDEAMVVLRRYATIASAKSAIGSGQRLKSVL